MMGSEIRILLVSRDVRVLQTRKLMLGAYFDVYPAARVGEANQLLAEKSFHLIILCYSLSEDECKKVLAAAREGSPEARVLTITFHGYQESHVANVPQISMDEGPLALLKRSAETLGFEFKTKGRLIHALQPKPKAAFPAQRCA